MNLIKKLMNTFIFSKEPMRGTYFKNHSRNPYTELTYEINLYIEPLQGTYERNLWMEPMKGTYERNLWMEHMKGTYAMS